MKKAIVATALALAFVMAGVSTSQAAGPWYPGCKILTVGTDSGGNVQVKLSHPDFPAKATGWFKITVAPDRNLSVVLTALSTGRTLKIKADVYEKAVSYYSTLHILYLER